MNTYHIYSLERKSEDPEIKTGHWERITTRPGLRGDLLREYQGSCGQKRYGAIKIRRA